MNTVKQLLQNKNHEVLSINSNKSAHDAMQLMADKKIGALPVLEGGKLIGIISERDYPGKAKVLDKPLQNVLVKEIMSNKVVHVNPDDTIEHCLKLVAKNHIRHLLALENDQIIGILSIGDLSKA